MGNDTPPIQPDVVWDPARALIDLKQEQDAIGPDSNSTIMTEQRFIDRAPLAADAIMHIMQHSSNERLRFDAAKYIVDRALGKVSDNGLGGGPNPLERLLQGVLIEDAARKGRALEVTSSDTTVAPPDPLSDYIPGDYRTES